MNETQELQVVNTQIIPAEKVNWGSTAAKELMAVVQKVGLSRKFGGDKPHLYAEAWQILGRFSGYHGICDEPEEVYEDNKIIGFKAQAHIYNQDDKEVSRATSFCMRDEPNWKNKPLFQLASMAQTRALSKAYRLDLGWVAVLAGYSPTPAEEMEGVSTSTFSQKTPPRAPGESTETKKPPTLAERKKAAVKWLNDNRVSVEDAQDFLKMGYADWAGEELEALKEWGKAGFPLEDIPD